MAGWSADTNHDLDRDLDLAGRAADGDAAAWDELLALYGRRLYNVAYQFARNPTEAEDLTQEIFVKLYRNLDRYRGNVPLIAWSLKLSRNLCIEHYRKARIEQRSTRVGEEMLQELPAQDDPQARAQYRQRLETVYRAMEGMTQDLATVLVLRDLQGWSYEETAAYLDVPMGTLKSRLVRARRDLARRVGELVAPKRPDDGSPGVLEVNPC